jgi:hypothetical protein
MDSISSLVAKSEDLDSNAKCREMWQVDLLEDSERTRVEVWTRVMGYHRPTSSFNLGKQGEFAERQYFKELRI